jgi:hypothetical protein
MGSSTTHGRPLACGVVFLRLSGLGVAWIYQPNPVALCQHSKSPSCRAHCASYRTDSIYKLVIRTFSPPGLVEVQKSVVVAQL